MRVSEIRVNQIRANQGLGVNKICKANHGTLKGKRIMWLAPSVLR